MKYAARRFLLSGLSLAALLVAGAVTAQDAFSPMEPRLPAQICNCSNPVNINMLKNSGPTSPDTTDFLPAHLVNPASYNTPQPNKLFAETIRWKLPTRTCELKGSVSYTVKNVANSSLQNNDTTALVAGGVSVPGTSQSIHLLLGQSQTFSYPLTSAQIHSGKVSIFVQDDTAVTQVRVNIRGCCINPS